MEEKSAMKIAFEEWATAHAWNCRIDVVDGKAIYFYETVSYLWQAWQAGAEWQKEQSSNS